MAGSIIRWILVIRLPLTFRAGTAEMAALSLGVNAVDAIVICAGAIRLFTRAGTASAVMAHRVRPR